MKLQINVLLIMCSGYIHLLNKYTRTSGNKEVITSPSCKGQGWWFSYSRVLAAVCEPNGWIPEQIQGPTKRYLGLGVNEHYTHITTCLDKHTPLFIHSLPHPPPTYALSSYTPLIPQPPQPHSTYTYTPSSPPLPHPPSASVYIQPIWVVIYSV